MLRRYFKYALLIIVFNWNCSAIAGSYEDFIAALKQDDAQVAARLIAAGFDPNARDPGGLPLLYVALREPAFKVAEVLTSARGIKVDARTPQDESPLMMAALRGHGDWVRRLVELGADVNKTGWTPLHYAATRGHLDVIRYLLEQHAYIDAESPNGTTPLMMAAHYGTPAAVKLLLDEGADPTLRNSIGLSAVDFAQRANRGDVAEMVAAAVRRRQPGGRW